MKTAEEGRREINKLISKDGELSKKLFERGFLFSSDAFAKNKCHILYNWVKNEYRGYYLLVHPDVHFETCIKDDRIVIIIGHAYNPFSMKYSDTDIIDTLVRTTTDSHFYSILNELTGIFTIIDIKDDRVRVYGDATCMQSAFFAIENRQLYVSSHTNLIGDILDLEFDDYVRELAEYKFFKLLGNQLPGDLTPFSEVRRLTPNHYLEYEKDNVRVERFFTPQHLDIDDIEVVEQVASLMHNNLELITKKWKSPAISLTGGCDSKTTLACANGSYDKYKYFSYSSSDEEEVDAIAASTICKELGLNHTLIHISQSDAEYDNVEQVSAILNWNTGGIRSSNANDIRKRIELDKHQEFDIEVKSWVSEVGRAYYSKRFNNRTNFGKFPRPRTCTTMYKFFLHNRALVRATDQVFHNYLNKYFIQDKERPIEWQEQLFWEYRMPSWNGIVITGEHRYSNDITIPYNNRLILQMLLSTSIENRINDSIYSQIRTMMNPNIDTTGVYVTNVKHTKKRAILENIYYVFNNILI